MTVIFIQTKLNATEQNRTKQNRRRSMEFHWNSGGITNEKKEGTMMIMHIDKLSRHMAAIELNELSLDFDGFNYLIIYGKHVNGGFIAIPNIGLCAEASGDPGDTFYNSEKLQIAGLPKDHADTIAHAIKVFAEVTGEEEKDGKA